MTMTKVFAGAAGLVLFAAACSSGTSTSSSTSTSEAAATDTSEDDVEVVDVDFNLLMIVPGGTDTSAAAVNTFFSCQNTEVTENAEPWISDDATQVDLNEKPVVAGEVSWDSELTISVEGDVRQITGNGLPTNDTGVYPIASGTEAYEYDRNPNSISAQDIDWQLPANPTVADEPSCLAVGATAITVNGAVFFNPVDAEGIIAAANEILDGCRGHPEQQGQYHFHSDSPVCLDHGDATGHSPLVGYALDGFGIYGHYTTDGELVTNEELDECHGHTHEVAWDGDQVEIYHYHTNSEFPFVLGCYKGTPTTVTGAGGGPGGGPPG